MRSAQLRGESSGVSRLGEDRELGSSSVCPARVKPRESWAEVCFCIGMTQQGGISEKKLNKNREFSHTWRTNALLMLEQEQWYIYIYILKDSSNLVFLSKNCFSFTLTLVETLSPKNTGLTLKIISYLYLPS